MKLARSGLVWLAVGMFMCLIGVASGIEEKADQEDQEEETQHAGMEVFLASKCSMCHTVLVAGIGMPEEAATEETEQLERVEPVQEEDDSGPPDLSDVGSRREAEWLHLYLSKKEAIDGRKHMKRFRGSDEDRIALVEWLTMQKAPSDTLAPETNQEAPDTASPAETGGEDDE